MFTTDHAIQEVPELKHTQFYLAADGLYDITYTCPASSVTTFLRGIDSHSELRFESNAEASSEVLSHILEDWELFKLRPEYCLGKFDKSSPEALQQSYEANLIACAFVRARRTNASTDLVWSKILRCIEWLRTTDIYTCPASTQYHDSEPSGLVRHTIVVAEQILNLIKAEPFCSTVKVEDAVLVALVHDWCKIGLYEGYLRNVKDEKTGQWAQVNAYRYKEDRAICLGHGVSSMYLATKFFHLSIDEAAAIRYHMGRWNCVDSEVNELQQANRMYPLVHLLQFADQLAITRYIR